MKILTNCTFPWVYQSYLKWFADHARPGAVPKQEEELAGAHSYNEDIFDDGHIVLSRMVYYVMLGPSEAQSGQPELFGFTELNLMECNGCEDVEQVIAVEYALL